ncbi:MAG: hypothetical protein QOH12_1836 [Solirubrobacteraceae bacterium]|nr:hypothetical protein [Solirubrobacteraceae bacterium]
MGIVPRARSRRLRPSPANVTARRTTFNVGAQHKNATPKRRRLVSAPGRPTAWRCPGEPRPVPVPPDARNGDRHRRPPRPTRSRGSSTSERTRRPEHVRANGLPKTKDKRIYRYSGRVSDGTRTRGRRDHNPELYQLSYAHQGRLRQSTNGSPPLRLPSPVRSVAGAVRRRGRRWSVGRASHRPTSSSGSCPTPSSTCAPSSTCGTPSPSSRPPPSRGPSRTFRPSGSASTTSRSPC